MNIAGKREWSLNGGGEIHPVVREKIDPEELNISTGHMRGTHLTMSRRFKNKVWKIFHVEFINTDIDDDVK